MTCRPEMAIFWALYVYFSVMIFVAGWAVNDELKHSLRVAFGVWVAVTALFFWRALVYGGGE